MLPHGTFFNHEQPSPKLTETTPVSKGLLGNPVPERPWVKHSPATNSFEAENNSWNRSILGPVVGGLLADPVKRFPQIFRQSSFWERYPFLLPNVVVAIVFCITSAAAFFLLTETNPRFSGTTDISTKVLQGLKRFHAKFTGIWRRPGHVEYTMVNGENGRLPTNDTDEHTAEIELSPRGRPSASNLSTLSQGSEDRPYTVQVILQILSVSLLAFHKIASDTLIPVFLAAPSSAGDVPKLRVRSVFHIGGGFGLSPASVGNVLLTQAMTAILVQSFAVPRIVTKYGPLRTYRWTLFVFPILYCMTPFVVKLRFPFSLIALLLDLWIKVLLVALGYVCSAIL